MLTRVTKGVFQVFYYNNVLFPKLQDHYHLMRSHFKELSTECMMFITGMMADCRDCDSFEPGQLNMNNLTCIAKVKVCLDVFASFLNHFIKKGITDDDDTSDSIFREARELCDHFKYSRLAFYTYFGWLICHKIVIVISALKFILIRHLALSVVSANICHVISHIFINDLQTLKEQNCMIINQV